MIDEPLFLNLERARYFNAGEDEGVRGANRPVASASHQKIHDAEGKYARSRRGWRFTGGIQRNASPMTACRKKTQFGRW